MKNTNVPRLLVLLAALGCIVQAGCNTVEGAGKDVEKTGEAIQRAAD